MAKNSPAETSETTPDAEVDEAGLSKAELERKRRQEARRELKRQKGELARIQKEMRGPTSKWVKIAIVVIAVLVVVLALGGYFIYCSYSVGIQRDSFTEEYNRADLTRLRQCAPDKAREVDDLKRQAENADGALSWQQVIDKYREAEEKLIQAAAAATNNADAYDSARTRFRVLKEEALKNKLDQYGRAIWARVLEADTASSAQAAEDFSIALATEKMTQTIQLLEKTSTSYAKLKDLDELSAKFRAQRSSVEEKEWERNVPEAWAAMQGLLKQIETAQESTDWATAADLCQQAMAMIAPALEKITALKTQAQEKISVMEQVIKTAAASGVPTAKPALWEKVGTEAKSARDGFSQSEYATAARTAQEVTAMLGAAGESVRQAQEGLGDAITQIKRLYDRATSATAFFAQNSAVAWRDVQSMYRQIPELQRQNKTFELVDLCKVLRAQLEALVQERDQLFADTKSAEDRLEAAAKTALFPHLQHNYPEPYERIEDLRRMAGRRRDRGELREARDLLVQAADGLEKQLKELEGVRSEVTELRASLSDRRERFREGIRRFMGAESPDMARNVERIEQMLTGHLYADAFTIAKGLDKLLPKTRYQVALKGAVVDYEKGVMWIADGGNESKQLDWYEALKWAAAQRFAGFDDWRLPTEEELCDLARLPATERRTLFPNTATGGHWSKIPAQEVAEALVVSVPAGTISREDKRKPFYVRAVRQPE
jgi:uncharacterized protein YktA (UPF0223 family)